MTARLSAEQLRLLGIIGENGQLEVKSAHDQRMATARGLEVLGFLRAVPRDGACCLFVLSGEGYMQCHREGLAA